ncbi:ABC transporter ATP-binding protein [Streptomyces sp. CB00455]|uniref:ABC transporter ATP-binding protein n=1 Tax=Streptomyces sp. CB00455 TaxID=1703927 RepID=UPI000D1A2B85
MVRRRGRTVTTGTAVGPPAPGGVTEPGAVTEPAAVPVVTVTEPGAVELRGVRRRYGHGAAPVHALRGIDLSLPHGSFTAVTGPSGSGKSTLLRCAAGLDVPTGGSVRLGGTEITGMDGDALAGLRRDRLGFVFQAPNLLPSLTVEQNVLLPLRLRGGGSSARDRARAADLLARVGLEGKGRCRPAELSAGRRRCVALARALVTRPEVVFADEPTGALDTTAAAELLGLLRSAARSLGATVVMATHDPAAAAHADQVIHLADGLITPHLPHAPTPTPAPHPPTPTPPPPPTTAA